MFRNNGATLNGKHTLYEYGLYITNSFPVEPPEPRTASIVVPGRDGSVDLTEALTGYTIFNNRTITLELGGKKPANQWKPFMSDFLNALHGKQVKVVFDDEKDFYYIGRAAVESDYKRGNEIATFTVKIDAEPYKYSVMDSVEPWKWGPFSFVDGVIRSYADIEVRGTRSFTVIGSPQPVIPVFETTADMKMIYEGMQYDLVVGKNKIYEIEFRDQEYRLIFTGNGTVSILFRERSL